MRGSSACAKAETIADDEDVLAKAVNSMLSVGDFSPDLALRAARKRAR